MHILRIIVLALFYIILYIYIYIYILFLIIVQRKFERFVEGPDFQIFVSRFS